MNGGAGAAVTAKEVARMPILELLKALEAVEPLDERRKLTQEVYALQETGWRKDSRWRGMPRHLVDEVHSSFRAGFARVLKESKPDKVEVRGFKQVNGSLHHHHGLEDQIWFPQLRKRHPEVKAAIDVLEKDHEALKELEGRVEVGDYEALQEFIAALFDHLMREEMISMPFLMDGTGGL